MWVRRLGFALLVCIPGVLHGSCTCSGTNESDSQLLFTTLDKCGRMPLVSHGVFEQIGRYVLKYQCIDSYKQEGPDIVVCYSNGTWSEIPTCRADKCGEFPVVTDGVVEKSDGRALHYACQQYYKLVGSAEVVCHSGGTWSEAPTCRPNYCSVNTADYEDLVNRGLAYFTNGETKRLPCGWAYDSFALVECIDGIPKISKCCNRFQINTGFCWRRGLMTD
ncbi:beta-2-glycoprotein 1-like [Odontesthes bonariensis]|uniref:beta-2-glycoprotein 1-like n=1 Tax=Odontesthes bonariensis TaxID=219752 RepID=UPI003F58F454